MSEIDQLTSFEGVPKSVLKQLTKDALADEILALQARVAELEGTIAEFIYVENHGHDAPSTDGDR